MPELWGMWSLSLLSSLPGPIWPGVVEPDKGPIYGVKIELNSGFLNFTVFFLH